MEVSITSETHSVNNINYLLGMESRYSQRSGSLESNPLNSSKRTLTPEPEQKKALTPSSLSDPPVFILTNDEDPIKLTLSPESGSSRQRERDAEREKQKELLKKEKEREIKEKEEDRRRLEELTKNFMHLEAEYKKQSATMESLEKEVKELRQTVAGLEAWSNEGKAHEANRKGRCGWFVQLFPCCFSFKKQTRSSKDIHKLEENELSTTEQYRTNGSV